MSAIDRAERGERTLSMDEMTGIQALERCAPDQPMRPRQRERQEFEYTRHGTQTLIASFDVATGRIAKGTVGDTRNEADYLAHLQSLIATDPNATQWHLVMDCLNTHQSESMVRYVAELERSGYRLRGERQIGYSEIDGNPSCFFKRVDPQGGVPFHSQALFLAESNRDLVFDLGEKVTEAGEFL